MVKNTTSMSLPRKEKGHQLIEILGIRQRVEYAEEILVMVTSYGGKKGPGKGSWEEGMYWED